MPNLYYGEKKDNMMIFDQRETHHLKVMRVVPGDIVNVTDGKGNKYSTKITEIKKTASYSVILDSSCSKRTINEKTIVFLPAAKWERLRWCIEKSVELNVSKIYIFRSEHATINHSMEKVKDVIIDSCKQCGRLLFPEVDMVPITGIEKNAEGRVLLLDFGGKRFEPEKRTTSLIIGPEGGFSRMDLETLYFAEKVSFTNTILRFETAAIVSLGIVSFSLGLI
jgi:16S rRNA (uracil1498-N3)-methyltransferase